MFYAFPPEFMKMLSYVTCYNFIVLLFTFKSKILEIIISLLSILKVNINFPFFSTFIVLKAQSVGLIDS